MKAKRLICGPIHISIKEEEKTAMIWGPINISTKGEENTAMIVTVVYPDEMRCRTVNLAFSRLGTYKLSNKTYTEQYSLFSFFISFHLKRKE